MILVHEVVLQHLQPQSYVYLFNGEHMYIHINMHTYAHNIHTLYSKIKIFFSSKNPLGYVLFYSNYICFVPF